MRCPRLLAPVLRRLAGRLKADSRLRPRLLAWADTAPADAPSDPKAVLSGWRDRAVGLLHRGLDRLSLIIPEPPKRLRDVPTWARVHFQWTICLVAGLIGLAAWILHPPANDPIRPRYVSNEARFRATVGVPLVRVAYVSDWPASVAAAYLAADLIRTRMVADVVFKPVASDALPDAWGMLVNDQADVFYSAWMPEHRHYLEESGSAVRLAGCLSREARMGLAVPAWMRAESIADLAAADAGGVVYGIDPGSRLNALAKRALEDYDLGQMRLVEMSERFMVEHLRAAMGEAQPVVVAAWSPHAIFGEFNLKFLGDPRGVFGEPGEIVAVLRSRFARDFENLSAFISRQRLTGAQFSDLVYRTAGAGNVALEVKKWIAQHPELVREWETPAP